MVLHHNRRFKGKVAGPVFFAQGCSMSGSVVVALSGQPSRVFGDSGLIFPELGFVSFTIGDLFRAPTGCTFVVVFVFTSHMFLGFLVN